MPVSTMPVRIRAARLDDVSLILTIEQATSAAAHWTADQYKNRIQSQPEEGHLLVAEYEGRLCGFVCARVVAGEWEIENVVVEEKLQRRGLGADLMRALIGKWIECSGTAMLLEVRESNLAARRLYEKHGFREAGRRREYYREPVEDAILYALDARNDAGTPAIPK